jgi:hypothetical protein
MPVGPLAVHPRIESVRQAARFSTSFQTQNATQIQPAAADKIQHGADPVRHGHVIYPARTRTGNKPLLEQDGKRNRSSGPRRPCTAAPPAVVDSMKFIRARPMRRRSGHTGAITAAAMHGITLLAALIARQRQRPAPDDASHSPPASPVAPAAKQSETGPASINTALPHHVDRRAPAPGARRTGKGWYEHRPNRLRRCLAPLFHRPDTPPCPGQTRSVRNGTGSSHARVSRARPSACSRMAPGCGRPKRAAREPPRALQAATRSCPGHPSRVHRLPAPARKHFLPSVTRCFMSAGPARGGGTAWLTQIKVTARRTP